MDGELRGLLEAQIGELERRINGILVQEEALAAKHELLRSIPGMGPLSAAMLLAEMPELGCMTAGEAASLSGLAPVPRDSGALRGRRISQVGDALSDRCSFKPPWPPRVTTQSSGPWPSASRRRASRTSWSSLPSPAGSSPSPMRS